MTPENEQDTGEVRAKFPLGYTVMTKAVSETFPAEKLIEYLMKHQSGDWGDTCEEDAATNENALKYGDRIMSVYKDPCATIWIITEADRSATTILYPHEY